MKTRPLLVLSALLFLAGGSAPAQEPSDEAAGARARANFARPIVLAEDDVRLFPEPPAGYRDLPGDVLRGHLEPFEYDSAVTGTRRKAQVYLPPGYPGDRRYPVLYLLHGIGGNEHEWTGYVKAHGILDNLIAAEKAVPMIVVLPNGRALPDDSIPDNPFAPEKAAGFARFENDLLDNLIPAIEAKYATDRDREDRAIAGLSMGGGQALNFGLNNLDTFAWVGGFSSAPNTRRPGELIKDHAEAAGKLRLLYVACGDRDGLFRISQGVHNMLEEQHVPHIYRVIPGGGHDFKVWKSDLYHFAQLLFREPEQRTSPPEQAPNDSQP
jgi:enterochelin esterase-like enzyme